MEQSLTWCTEEEATQKWCPQVRTAIEVEMSGFPGLMRAAACNESDNGYEPCKGSKCMMWVWRNEEDQTERGKGRCGLVCVR